MVQELISIPIEHRGQDDRRIVHPDRSVTPAHAQEWQESAVAAEIVGLNVRSLDGEAIYDYLFYSEQLPRTNTGRLTAAYLREYACLEAGGWWCSGLDPLNNWQRMLWGQFKADVPRCKAEIPSSGSLKTRVVKYEPPPKLPTRAYFLDVPDPIAERVYQKAGINPAAPDRIRGFWHCVWDYNLPIVITEGAKKAGALLTAGYAAIALPGISSGYRTPKDANGLLSGQRHLIPDLQYFATAHRPVYFCFDHDQKPTTQAAVRINIAITGKLFADAGCSVSVIQLPGPEKGVDDFLAAQSVMAIDRLYQAALPLSTWQALQMFQLTTAPNLQINQRYLGTIALPQSGLVCIKSAKGTGKTALLEPLIRDATRAGRKTLVISHRVQLGQVICDRCGIDYISELRQSTTQGTLGFGLCIDSLHPQGQAQFNPQAWKGAIVILDECEQVLWHALNSTTCKRSRVSILKTLRELLNLVLSSGGLVIAQDADLSDFSIDFLKEYAGIPVEPWVVINQWQAAIGAEVHFYDTPDPGALWLDLEKTIDRGAVFICTDAQKTSSKWGTVNIEIRLQQQFPAKKILRIDSETVADPNHSAYGCTEKLNQLLPSYDIVVASPSIGSGVSIDVRDHFVAVFGIFQGTVPDNEARQALARVRQAVPRYVWGRPFGVGKIANGSVDYRSIASSTHKQHQANIHLLKDVDFDIDQAYDPITFRTWAKFAARVNASLVRFRDTLRFSLSQEGHQIQVITPVDQDLALVRLVNEVQTEIRNRSRFSEAIAVADSPDISHDLYQKLLEQRSKTRVEYYQQEKHRLQQRYGAATTPELYLLDQNSWYGKIRLHYYLTHDRAWVQQRDRAHWQEHLAQGDGAFCPQDIRTYSERVETLRLLGITEFLQIDREFRGTDAWVQACVDRALQWRSELKTLFHITIPDHISPMQVIQILLGLLGLKLQRDRRAKLSDGSRCWVYRGLRATEEEGEVFELRSQIFAHWASQEMERSPNPTLLPPSLDVEGHPPDITPDHAIYQPYVPPKTTQQDSAPSAAIQPSDPQNAPEKGLEESPRKGPEPHDRFRLRITWQNPIAAKPIPPPPRMVIEWGDDPPDSDNRA